MMMHNPMMGGLGPSEPGPNLSGQDAFGVVNEIVRILEADPDTDWSKVNLDALSEHLIDMNEVTLHADAALGFIGVMASGAHHPMHHLMMAKGELLA